METLNRVAVLSRIVGRRSGLVGRGEEHLVGCWLVGVYTGDFVGGRVSVEIPKFKLFLGPIYGNTRSMVGAKLNPWVQLPSLGLLRRS